MKKEQLHGEGEREITEREKRAYRANKGQTTTPRRELPRDEAKLFLRLVSEMASSVDYETKLGMTHSDVDYYKRQFDIEDYSEARTLLQRMDLEDARAQDDRVEDNRRQAREAEAAAQERLDAYEAQQAVERSERAKTQTLSAAEKAALADKDAQRQRAFDASQTVSIEDTDWRLPEVDGPLRGDIIRRFQHELGQQGLSFCRTKYGCTVADLKSEAKRLGVRINWDTVPR
jgi:hypothetical protein